MIAPMPARSPWQTPLELAALVALIPVVIAELRHSFRRLPRRGVRR